MFDRKTIFLLFFAHICSGHDPISTKLTWSRDISRLVYRRCAACHHPGGAAMSLLHYVDARPWAVAISDEVLSRRMPPWGAVKGFGEFQPDLSLTQEEITLFAEWVAGGAPEGDPAVLPPPYRAGKTSVTSPPAGKELRLVRDSSLPAPIRLVAIRPDTLPAGSSAQLTAQRPDGSVEPLLWLRDYRPAFVRTYVYATPIALPAGTRIQVTPAHTGSFVLIYRSGLRSHK